MNTAVPMSVLNPAVLTSQLKTVWPVLNPFDKGININRPVRYHMNNAEQGGGEQIDIVVTVETTNPSTWGSFSCYRR